MIRVGWRDYLRQRFKKTSRYFSVGIEINSQGLYVSVFRAKGGEYLWRKQATLPLENWQEALKRYVSKQNLTNTPCNVSIGLDGYQLLQIDRPQVEEEEVAQALMWPVKDVMGTQDELILDYFDLPAQSAGANKVHVVAISKSEISTITDGIRNAGLDLQSINVAELAIADLIGNSEEAVMTLMQRNGQEMCLSIFKQGQLYFSRRLRGYENLANFSEQELQMGVGDNLSVEIQRSMDYFESQLRQAQVKKILLVMDTPNAPQLANVLKQLTFMEVEPLSPNVISNTDIPMADTGFVCLGAGLQNAVVNKEASA